MSYDEIMNRYRCEYQTIPSPALTYYEGSIEVFAEDEYEAEQKAIRWLSRIGNYPASCIRIVEVKQID